MDNRTPSKIELLKKQIAEEQAKSSFRTIHENEDIENLRKTSRVTKGFTQPEQGVSRSNMFNAAKNKYIQDELEGLRRSPSTVRDKAKLIETLLGKTTSLMQLIKNNATSDEAKKSLTLVSDMVFFEQAQTGLIGEVQTKLKSDIQLFSISPLVKEINYVDFLKLSFIYRTYEVCLEEDCRRHLAARWSQHASLSFTNQYSKLAIQSLNYYEDFFKYLIDVEKIWPDAGVHIRRLETKIVYVSRVYDQIENIVPILNKEPAYLDAFEESFVFYLAGSDIHSAYIKNGDGLNANTHPWTKINCSRLAQPNKSIDFKALIPIDEQVEIRMNQDKKKFGM